jgi:hypothetical protein
MTFKPIPLTLYKSKNSSKKFTVFVPKNEKLIKVDFGAKGMGDYTIYYKEKGKDFANERRRLYRLRHKNDNLNNPYSPGFWSFFTLWGDSPTLGIAFEDSVKRATEILKRYDYI